MSKITSFIVKLIIVLMIFYLTLTSFLKLFTEQVNSYKVDEVFDHQKNSEITLPLRSLNLSLEPSIQEFSFSLLTDNIKESVDEKTQEQYFLYFPRFEQDITITVNGNTITNKGNISRWQGPLIFNSAFIHIPPYVFNGEVLNFKITISTNSLPPISLYPFFIGNHDNLNLAYVTHQFLEKTTRQISMVLLILVLTISIIIYLKLPYHKEYLWLAIASGLFLPLRFSNLVFGMDKFIEFVPWLYFLIPLATLSIFYYIKILIQNKYFNIPLIPTILFVLLGALSAFIGLLPLRQAIILVSLPIVLFSLFFSLSILVKHTYQSSSSMSFILLCSVLFLFISFGHDVLVLNNYLSHTFLISYISVFILLLTIIIQLFNKLIELLNNIKLSNVFLNKSLVEADQALADAYEQQRLLSIKTSISAERGRITEELHDGIAGHLTSILTIARNNENEHNKQIAKIAKYTINELRLLIDTFETESDDLAIVLSIVRERILMPLEASEIKTTWWMNNIDPDYRINPNLGLDLIRILQECINNAVKHGKPKIINVEIYVAGPDVQIELLNHGGEAYYKKETGHGLRNIKKRLKKFTNASFSIRKIETGAASTITFTLEDTKNS